MLYRELTKSQKKKVKQLIDRALIRDYTDGVKRIKSICDSFVDGKSNPKEFYHKLYSTMASKDKEIGRRYDNLTGSKYFMVLIILVREGVLSNDDIHELDDGLKEIITIINKNL
jgi:hypothetical protein